MRLYTWLYLWIIVHSDIMNMKVHAQVYIAMSFLFFFFCFFWVYLRADLLGHMAILYLTSLEMANLFFRVDELFPSVMNLGSNQFLHILTGSYYFALITVIGAIKIAQ